MRPVPSQVVQADWSKGKHSCFLFFSALTLFAFLWRWSRKDMEVKGEERELLLFLYGLIAMSGNSSPRSAISPLSSFWISFFHLLHVLNYFYICFVDTCECKWVGVVFRLQFLDVIYIPTQTCMHTRASSPVYNWPCRDGSANHTPRLHFPFFFYIYFFFFVVLFLAVC